MSLNWVENGLRVVFTVALHFEVWTRKYTMVSVLKMPLKLWVQNDDSFGNYFSSLSNVSRLLSFSVTSVYSVKTQGQLGIPCD